MAIPFQSEIEVPTIKFKQSTASSVPTILAARTLGFWKDKLYFGDTMGRPIPCNGILPLDITWTASDSSITGNTTGLTGKYNTSNKTWTWSTGTLSQAYVTMATDYSIWLALDPNTTTQIRNALGQTYSVIGWLGHFVIQPGSMVYYSMYGYAILR